MYIYIYIYIYLRHILIQAKELGPRRGIVTLPQMHAFALVVGCIFYLECFFSAFPALADNMDLKQLFAGSEPTKPNGHNVGVRIEFPAEVKVRQGKEVFEYAKLHFELADLEKAISTGTIRTPPNFLLGFFDNVLKRKSSLALKKQYRKAFLFYMAGLKGGAVTTNGLLGDFRRGQRRDLGGELNALKCPEIGQLLYNWFIDCVQILRGRADGTFIMRQAYLLKERFLLCGCKPDSLPKLLGKAGDSWFYRWRKRFDVSFMKSVKRLKCRGKYSKHECGCSQRTSLPCVFYGKNISPGPQCVGSAGTRCPRGLTIRRWTALMLRGALCQLSGSLLATVGKDSPFAHALTLLRPAKALSQHLLVYCSKLHLKV